MSTEARNWWASASTNSDTRIPAARSADTIGRKMLCFPATSSPPSVVTSVRFSGASSGVRLDQSWDARGALQSVTRFSVLAGPTTISLSAYAYDGVGRTTNIRHQSSAGVTHSEFTTTYDAAGRLTQETFNGANTTYGYDSTDQVTNAGTETFAYDAAWSFALTTEWSGRKSGPIRSVG